METLNTATEWFIGHCSNHRKLSAHTLKAYRHDLKLFGDFISNQAKDDSSPKISTICKTGVQAWIAAMREVKPRTIRRRVATVSVDMELKLFG